MFLRDAEDELVTVWDADAQEENESDGASPGDGAHTSRAVRVGDHDDALQSETRHQPVGEVASDAVQVVGELAVDVREVDGRPHEVHPLEPDAEQFEVHDAEVRTGEGEKIHGRAQVTHLSLRQHDQVEDVRNGAGDDDRDEAHPDVVEDVTQPHVVVVIIIVVDTRPVHRRRCREVAVALRTCRRHG